MTFQRIRDLPTLLPLPIRFDSNTTILFHMRKSYKIRVAKKERSRLPPRHVPSDRKQDQSHGLIDVIRQRIIPPPSNAIGVNNMIRISKPFLPPSPFEHQSAYRLSITASHLVITLGRKQQSQDDGMDQQEIQRVLQLVRPLARR